MRVDDGGSSSIPVAAPPPPPPPPPAPAPKLSADVIAANAADAPVAAPAPGRGQLDQSSATYPGAPDSISFKNEPPQLRRELQQEAQSDYEYGTFNNGSADQSSNDAKIASEVTRQLATAANSGQPTNQNNAYDVSQYVAGKIPGQDAATPAQRLQNTLAALGPTAAASWLQNMPQADFNNLGIQSSFDSLVAGGQLTPSDARALVDGETNKNTQSQTFDQDFRPSATASLVQGLGNDQNSVAFKDAYAHQSLNAADGLSTTLASGKLGGEDKANAQSQRTLLYANALNVLNATPNDDSTKRAAFEQMRTAAQSLATSPDSNDQATASRVDAYALDVLGGASGTAAALELRHVAASDHALDSHGNIATGSQLDSFLKSAVAGQAALGNDPLGVGFELPSNGVAKILGSLAQGPDTKLTQGVLSNITDSFIADPSSLQAIQSQASNYGGGLQKSISDAVSSSFTQLLGQSGVAAPNDTLTGRLTAISGIENGPPFEAGQAKAYSDMLQQKLQPIVDFAMSDPSVKNPDLQKLFSADSDPTESRENAARTAGSISQSYITGAYLEQTALGQSAAGQKTPDVSGVLKQAREVTSLAALIPGTQEVTGPLSKATAAAASIQDLLFPPDPNKNANKATATLKADDASAGVTAGVGDFEQWFQPLQAAFSNIPGRGNDLRSNFDGGSSGAEQGDNISLGTSFFAKQTVEPPQ